MNLTFLTKRGSVSSICYAKGALNLDLVEGTQPDQKVLDKLRLELVRPAPPQLKVYELPSKGRYRRHG
jgi:hypothetical protein